MKFRSFLVRFVLFAVLVMVSGVFHERLAGAVAADPMPAIAMVWVVCFGVCFYCINAVVLDLIFGPILDVQLKSNLLILVSAGVAASQLWAAGAFPSVMHEITVLGIVLVLVAHMLIARQNFDRERIAIQGY